jgi:hypothetical protein
VKVFLIWLLISSPALFLYNILGWLAVVVWVANTVILSLLTRYVMTRKRGNYDGWDGYDD